MVLRTKWGTACRMLITLQGIWWWLDKVSCDSYFGLYCVPVSGSHLNTYTPCWIPSAYCFSKGLTPLPLFLIWDLCTFSVFNLSSSFQHANPRHSALELNQVQTKMLHTQLLGLSLNWVMDDHFLPPLSPPPPAFLIPSSLGCFKGITLGIDIWFLMSRN